MKTRTKIVTFTFAMLLMGSIAYAATDRKEQAKLELDESDLITEEDTLCSELLAPSAGNKELPKTAEVNAGIAADDSSDVFKGIKKAVEH